MADRTSQLRRREKMQMPIATLIELFAATKKTEGKSPRTIVWYSSFLAKFREFLGGQPTLVDVNLDNARAHIAHLQSRTTRSENHPLTPAKEGGLSPYTVHAHARTLKAFASWLADEGFTAANVRSASDPAVSRGGTETADWGRCLPQGGVRGPKT
jgi:site-specific recombinase XerD